MKTAYVLATAAVYLIVIIIIGRAAARRTTRQAESYFLANRGLARVVLLASAFGTNMSAFTLLGLPGDTYTVGVGLWGILAGTILFLIPLNFYLGYRCWLVARYYKYVTPVEFYRERFQSHTLAVLMFIAFVTWTIPYILIGIVGAGRALATFTEGTLPYWAGALLVTVVVAYYTLRGGMLGTAWTNVGQVAIFLSFVVLTVILVPFAVGGTDHIATRLLAEQPELLYREWDGPLGWGAQVSNVLLFSFVLFVFPFVWIRMIAARSGRDLRFTAISYPFVSVILNTAVVLLGLWAAVLVPGLEGAQSDAAIFALAGQYLPLWMTAFGVVALLAFVMSSMDAQVLTTANMLTWDMIGRYRKSMREEQKVLYTRVFIVALLALLYGLSFLELPGIFDITAVFLTGFAAFYPVMVGGIFWRRATKYGAIASLIIGQVVAVAGFLGWYPSVAGLQPVFWVFVAGWTTFITVSLFTPAQHEAAERFHTIWDRATGTAVRAPLVGGAGKIPEKDG